MLVNGVERYLVSKYSCLECVLSGLGCVGGCWRCWRWLVAARIHEAGTAGHESALSPAGDAPTLCHTRIMSYRPRLLLLFDDSLRPIDRYIPVFDRVNAV